MPSWFDEVLTDHPDWPRTPWGMPYDPDVGYNTGFAGGRNLPWPTEGPSDPARQIAPVRRPPGGYQAPPGYEARRLNNPRDNDPKTVWGRYVSDMRAKGREPDPVAFVQDDLGVQYGQPVAGAWRMNEAGQIWVDQDVLNRWKPGRSVPQDVSGGGYRNATGDRVTMRPVVSPARGGPGTAPAPPVSGPAGAGAPPLAARGQMSDGPDMAGGPPRVPLFRRPDEPIGMSIPDRLPPRALDGPPTGGPPTGGGVGPRGMTPEPGFTPFDFGAGYQPGEIGGPDRLTLGLLRGPGDFTFDRLRAPSAYQATRFSRPDDLVAERLTPRGIREPNRIEAPYITAPEALTLDRFTGPGPFRAPTDADLASDPGVQFRLAEGRRAFTDTKAAQGVARTGGAVRQLEEYAQRQAAQEYAALYARRFGEHEAAYREELGAIQANNAARAQGYGLTNQFGQAAALANQRVNLEVQRENIANRLQADTFTAAQSLEAQRANAANALGAGQFNRSIGLETDRANEEAAFRAWNATAGYDQNVQAQNARNAFDAFNANAGYNLGVQRENIGNRLAEYQAYQPAALQARMFNAGRQDQASQANTANRLAAFQANIGAGLGYGNLGVSTGNLALQRELGLGNLGVSTGDLALRRELGTGNLALERELGIGNLSLGNRRADLERELGLGNLDLGRYGAETTRALGWGNINLGNRQADIQRELGLGNIGLGWGNIELGNRRADIDRELGFGNIGLGWGNVDLGRYRADQEYDLGLGGQGLGWANYGLNEQGQYWNQDYNVWRSALDAALSGGRYGSEYADRSGRNVTDVANANAAGRVGSQNAWNQGLTNAWDSALYGYGVWKGRRQPPPANGPYDYTGNHE